MGGCRAWLRLLVLASQTISLDGFIHSFVHLLLPSLDFSCCNAGFVSTLLFWSFPRQHVRFVSALAAMKNWIGSIINPGQGQGIAEPRRHFLWRRIEGATSYPGWIISPAAPGPLHCRHGSLRNIPATVRTLLCTYCTSSLLELTGGIR